MIPFNKPYLTGDEKKFIASAFELLKFSGDGVYTKQCSEWLERQAGVNRALLTHSCTGALEMAALLCGISEGDEVIMPSYTFTSTANAFVLRGAKPVFVDIRPDTLNLNENLIENAITPNTKAIVPVHYAGVSCEMDKIMHIAARHGLYVVEDAAQGLLASYKGKSLGAIGSLGAISFHETKNIISGEGGALYINNPVFLERAEIIREKGTNRSQFHRGLADKYTWLDIGSSYLPSEILAAFLFAQLSYAEEITRLRLKAWNRYHDAFELIDQKGLISRPFVPSECMHNGHLYYLKFQSLIERDKFIHEMSASGIACPFHYIPLHSSIAGKRYGKVSGSMEITDNIFNTIVRLPLWAGIEKYQDLIIKKILLFFREKF